MVLIPSGEGDCENFSKVAEILSDSFTVTTFDMPGMSRSIAPESAMQDLTSPKLTAQVVGLLNELSIDKASFYGCSSGGLVALTLAAEHSSRVRNIIVHEVPLAGPGGLTRLTALSDADVVATCRNMFTYTMAGDQEKWNALSPAYHKRLEKNWVTWVRTYINHVETSFSNEELTQSPVCWTIGSQTPAQRFEHNVEIGRAAGISVGQLPARHFPQVTIPDVLAEHIRTAVNEYL